MLQEFTLHLEQGRYVDAAVLFAESGDLDDYELLNLALSRLLPPLVANHSVWLIKNPHLIEFFEKVCERALDAQYNPAQVMYTLAHLRCYKAIELVMEHRIKQAHAEILKASGLGEDFGPPKANAGDHPTPEMLASFFVSYFEHLRTHGHESAVQKINWIIERAIWQLEQDESRSGVVKALFVNRQGEGLLRIILVALGDGQGVDYQHLGGEELGADLRDSAEMAREAAHVFLVGMGYPEGLSQRKVVWQISRLDGRSEDTRIIYDGNSAGLALAVAIISAYLMQSIPSDTAFTGALNILTKETGDVIGVSNVSEKLHTALKAGVTRLYLPVQNRSDLSLAATKAAEGKVEIKAIRQLHSAGRELFYRQKDPSGVFQK